MTGIYKIQGAKCVKYNDLYKSEHHCQFTWYCKTNEKTNPSKLKTKKRNHTFTSLSVQITKRTANLI